MRDRVERVLELAPRPHHVVEQLHVLDRARELAAELVGAIEQVELAAGLDAHAFEDDRAERAAAAAQRHGDRRGAASSSGERDDFRARAAHRRPPPAPSGRRRRRARRAPRARDRTTPAARDGARGDRESRPTCDRRRTADWRRGRRCRGRPTRFSVAERLAENSSSSSRRSRCSSSLCRRRNSSSAVDERVADFDDRRRSTVVADGGASKPIASRPIRSAPRTSGRSSAARASRAAPRGPASGGRRRRRASASPRERARRRAPPRPAPGIHGSVRSASRPKPEVACSTPLRGLCWKSSEQRPPVTSSACWCRCGSRSLGVAAVREQRHQRPLGRVGAVRRDRSPAASGQSPASCSRGIDALAGRPFAAAIVLRSIDARQLPRARRPPAR